MQVYIKTHPKNGYICGKRCNMSEVLIPESWGELQEMLFHNTWDDRISRHRSPFIYRGINDGAHRLHTSLQRLGGPFDRLEKHIIRNFKKYAHRDASHGSSVWNWLAVAQHHGLPTRLLDWTYSPYVSLHFATNDLTQYDRDGAIWVLNYVELKNYLPNKLLEAIHKEQSNVFTAEMLSSVCSSLSELDQFLEDDFLVFLEPPSLDNRIVNQFALFSLLSNPRTILDDWLLQHDEVYSKIVIPQALKWEIRDKLDQANITERVLFPGLGGLSQWLTRHYSSKNKHTDL